MPLPLIPIILGGISLAAAAAGVKKGLDGLSDMEKAKEIRDRAKRRYDTVRSALKSEQERVNRRAEDYGKLLIEIKTVTFQRFIDFLESIQNRVEREKYLRLLREIEVDPPKISEYRDEISHALNIAGGIVSAGATGAMTAGGAWGLVGLLGTASTGTAISGLSGAAATNATLAWFGGGSLAAGGLGMAGGTVVLGGVIAGPLILGTGWVLASEGEKALTQAKKLEAESDIAVEKMYSTKAFLKKLKRRINELYNIASKLDKRTKELLSSLNPRTFSVENREDVRKFQFVGQFIAALSEISKTPILDKNGELTASSHRVFLKYKDIQLY